MSALSFEKLQIMKFLKKNISCFTLFLLFQHSCMHLSSNLLQVNYLREESDQKLVSLYRMIGLCVDLITVYRLCCRLLWITKVKERLMNARSMYHQPSLNFKELVALHFLILSTYYCQHKHFPRGHGPFDKHQESEHLSKL